MRTRPVVEVSPQQRLLALLPQLTFADAYCVTAPSTPVRARDIAFAIFAKPPTWTSFLMSLRNRAVRRFGLKTPEFDGNLDQFVITESAEEILLGLDDSHLDFRIVVGVRPFRSGGVRQVTVTSLVRPHNRLGRTYLRMVLPFHGPIVRRLIKRAAASWDASVCTA